MMGARPQVLLESGEPIMSPSWSPNGQDVAYVSFETGLPRIYIQNIASGQRRQITNYPNINSSVLFGLQMEISLLVVLSKDGSPDIYVQDLISNQPIRVTDHPAIDTEPSWTPDGQFIVFMSDRTGQLQIYQIALGANSYDVERLTYDCFSVLRPDFAGRSQFGMHVRRETRQALQDSNIEYRDAQGLSH